MRMTTVIDGVQVEEGRKWVRSVDKIRPFEGAKLMLAKTMTERVCLRIELVAEGAGVETVVEGAGLMRPTPKVEEKAQNVFSPL